MAIHCYIELGAPICNNNTTTITFVPTDSAPRRPARYWTYSSNLDNHHPMSTSKALLQWLGVSFWLGRLSACFRSEIAVTTQRPDIVIFSWSKKAVLLIELIVPHEDRVMAGHTRKENRYAALVQQYSENGWFARCIVVEVGCLGYVSSSLLHCLESLGIPSSTSRKLRNVCSCVARQCSYVLFLRRKCTAWCSEIGSLASLDAPEVHASSDVREPISLHQAVLNGSPGQWVSPSALLHSSHDEPSSRQVCRVLFDLCPILPMDLGPQPVQAARCADVSCPVPVRAARARRVHGSSWPRKSVL